jgi:hypothetical protein
MRRSAAIISFLGGILISGVGVALYFAQQPSVFVPVTVGSSSWQAFYSPPDNHACKVEACILLA